MYSILPISAVSSGLSIIIPLYILSLKGNAFDVGIAIALFNIIEIPASIFWGEITEKIGRTKLFILVSVVGVIPIFFLLYLIRSVVSIQASYALYAFMATAASPALNILIMGARKSRLPRYFSRYSVLVILGSFIALVPGIFLTDGRLYEFLFFVLGLNIVSVIMALVLISADKRHMKKEQRGEIKRSFSILNLISVTPFVLTGHALINRISAGLNDKKIKSVYILLSSVALFNAGLYLFNTSYIPYLNENFITYSGIFSINLSNAVGQLLVYTVVIGLLSRLKLETYYNMSAWVRVLSYAIVFLPILSIVRNVFYVNLVAYAVAGIGYGLWNVSSSVLLYSHIKKMRPAHYIGIWSAILGVSAVVGSFLSGFVSNYIGYGYTFFMAIAAIFLSLIVFNKKIDSIRS